MDRRKGERAERLVCSDHTAVIAPPDGLLLDMCNILYDETAWRRWVLQLLLRLGLHTNYRSFFRVWDREYLADVNRGHRDFREAFEAFLRSAGLARGLIDEVEAACQSRRHQLETNIRPLPGVKTALKRLHSSGMVLGAINNSDRSAPELRDRLKHLGIDQHFTAVVSSIDLQQAMPHPAPYRAAMKALGLPPSKMAFVSHDTAELVGAAELGMSTIALNFDPDAMADVYLDRFDALPQAVSTQQSLAAAG